MKALQYKLSIPKYILAKGYHSLVKKKLPPIFPNLYFEANLPQPEIFNENWVIIKSYFSGICGSDQNMLLGNESFSMEPYASFPCVLGHENVGEIVRLGENVKGFSIGDKVVVNPVMDCFVHERTPCEYCSNDQNALCNHFGDKSALGPGMSLGYHESTGGGWSEYFQAHQSMLHRIPKNLDLKQAVLVDPLSSVLQPILRSFAEDNNKNKGKTVFIYGAGTLGLLGVFAIKALNLPWKVICGYRHSFQGEIAKKMGADHIIQTGNKFIENFIDITESSLKPVSIGKPNIEGGVDIVFDCVGSAKTLDDSLRMTKARGEVVLIATGHDLKGVDPTPLWFKEVNLRGSCMSGKNYDPRDKVLKSVYSIAIDLLSQNDASELLTHEFGLNDYKKALRVSLNKKEFKSVKVVFNIQK